MQKFMQSIEREYLDYRAKMLKEPPEFIWDRCCEIYFYSSFYEYFLYNEDISCSVAEQLGTCENIIAGCWQLYLKVEELSILSWEDIGEILERYLQSVGGKNSGNQRICRET